LTLIFRLRAGSKPIGYLTLAIVLLLSTQAASAAQTGSVTDLLSDADVLITGGAQPAVAPGGDVNGDGSKDLLFGSGGDFGSVTALFGPFSKETIDIRSLGARGFRIDGTHLFSGTGSAVASIGDMNGDGLDELIVGAPGTASIYSANAYVVFGKTTSDPIDLSSLGAHGFSIKGAGPPLSDTTGKSVDGAGDVNGDGIPDVIVGNPDRDAAYVVFGKASTDEVNLAALGAGGFRIETSSPAARLGESVAGVGDMNGDGLDEVIVGAPRERGDGVGAAYVVFGKSSTSTVSVTAIGAQGFRILGPVETYPGFAGNQVAGVDDVNGDGLPDVLVSAQGISSEYLVFGKAGSSPIDLGALGNGGFEIEAPGFSNNFLSFTAESIAGAPDMDGDGRPELLVGVPGEDFAGRVDAGAGWAVLGKASTSTVQLIAGAPDTLEYGGPVAGRGFGIDVAGDDLNDDGLGDMVVALFGGVRVVFSVPATCELSAAGQITTREGDRATFSGVARGSVQSPSGHQTYRDLGPAQPLSIRSTSIDRLFCAVDGSDATVFGEAELAEVGPVQFRIDVRDRGAAGAGDSYRIRLSNGYDSGAQGLDAGNVQITRR
jgi:hypothetical protein